MGFTPLVRHTLNSVDVRMQVISSLLSKSSSRSETKGLFGNDDKERKPPDLYVRKFKLEWRNFFIIEFFERFP